MKAKILSAALAVVLCLASLPTPALAAESLDNFKKIEDYPAGKFTDVAGGNWYTGSVQTAYELGLVKGSSATAFSPDGSITVGSALALACRLHSIYATGGAHFEQGTPWYAVYVDYAVKNGIVTQNQFSDYNANATRRQFAAILAKALPETALTEKNTVPDNTIPDVAAGSANAAEIYRLYRAGVLTGSDKYGTFAPETTIDRASVAAIVSRMAQPALRQQVKLEPAPVAASGITLNKTALSVSVGGSSTLTAVVAPENAADKTVTWTSSKPSVATVSNGTVTGVANGTAVITATTVNGLTATCTVEVAQVGTRSNPLPADGSQDIPYHEYSFMSSKQIRVECTGLLTGSDAAAVVAYENMYNKAPSASQEWRVYDFTLTYTSSVGGDDDELKASDVIYRDTFFTASGSNVSAADTATFSEDLRGYSCLDVRLYPGGSGRVVICTLVQKDLGDFLLKIPSAGGKSNTWILCAPGTAGNLAGHPALNGSGSSSGTGDSGDLGGDSDSTSGSDSSDDGKFSYNDARTLNRSAKSAASDTTAGMRYANDSHNGYFPEQDVLTLKQAISSGLSSARHLSDALDILNNRLDVNLTNGKTLRQLVQDNYDLLMTLEDIEVTVDNIDTTREEIWDILSSAGATNLAFQNLTVKMLDAF